MIATVALAALLLEKPRSASFDKNLDMTLAFVKNKLSVKIDNLPAYIKTHLSAIDLSKKEGTSAQLTSTTAAGSSTTNASASTSDVSSPSSAVAKTIEDQPAADAQHSSLKKKWMMMF